MLKVAEAVRDIIKQNPSAHEALECGYLNLSAYAKLIRPQVASKTMKSVEVGTIVAALTRMQVKISKDRQTKIDLEIDDVAVKAGLAEITFEKTKQTHAALQKCMQMQSDLSEFFVVTQGLAEITLIIQAKRLSEILEHFSPIEPILILSNLASITLRFDPKYIEVPNMLYSLLCKLAIERILIIEIISTFTEISIIVRKNDLQRSFQIMSGLLQNDSDFF